MTGVEGLTTIPRPEKETFVGSSIQFLLPGLTAEGIAGFVARCAARGVELKWFGADEPAGFTSRYDHWRYAPVAELPRTDRVLAGLLDMRLPLTFSLEDCALVGRIIADETRATNERRAAE